MDKNPITYFAETDNRNKRLPFGIKSEDRTRHMYVIGKTGMGKSTLLENMAIQDIKNGEGLAFIDPHGKTADLLLDYIPQERMKDVVYFAPFDLEHPISFNVMEDVGYEKRHLVANGLMSAFKKIWVDAWSARMEYILNNILLALLEYPDSTLIGVNRMLVDKEYRKKVVDNITDPSVKAFWTDEYAKYTDRFAAEAAPAIQNKIGQFISNPLVRNIIGQPKSTFDLRKIMDEKKILIINLSKGRVGESNANLLGSMLITKIYLAAMSRADASPGMMRNLPNFYLYVDEFQSFANESFADILSEARKYKLNLLIAHQYIEQMSEEVRAAVFGNVGTMVVFRVGSFDAEVLEKEFFPTFTKEDIVNLGFVQVYMKLMIDGVASSPFSARTLPPIEKPLVSFKEDIIRYSRSTYAKPRAEVEDTIKKWHEALNSGPVNPDKKKFDNKPSGNYQGNNRDRDTRPTQNGSLDELKKFARPPKKDQQPAQESELRKAIATMYSHEASSEKPSEKAPEKIEPQQAKPVPVQPSQQAQQPRQEKSQQQERKPELPQQQSVQPQPPKPQLQNQPNPKKDNKGPSVENLSALKDALSAVIKAPSRDSEQKTESRTQPQGQSQKSTYIPPEPKAESEVPEEVLNRIFDIDR